MIYSLKGLWLTLVSTVNGFRQPVTRQYPATGTLWSRTEAPTPVQPRFMGFPALTWDDQVGEPYCTSCMVCIRQCPTQCMSATMKDNPLQQEGSEQAAGRSSTASKSTSIGVYFAGFASRSAISTPSS